MYDTFTRVLDVVVVLALVSVCACGGGGGTGGDADAGQDVVQDTVDIDVASDPPPDEVPLDTPAEEVVEDPVEDVEPDDTVEEEVARTYTCIRGCRNGLEECDDESFTVPSPYVPMVLVCQNDNGGIAYVATNTGPPCLDDGVPRCRGWEERGEHAWDVGNLDYIVSMECTEAGMTLDVDLSSHEGERLYVGVHDHPEGGGHMTQVCIATWD